MTEDDDSWADGGADASAGYDTYDGGLPPGGAPEQRACYGGPCPTCSASYQMSSQCAYPLGHDGDHACASGHTWTQAGPSDAPGGYATCGKKCPTYYCEGYCQKSSPHALPHNCGEHDFN